MDAVYALVEDEESALEAAHHGLRVAGARWPRWAWLPIPEARILKQATAHAKSKGHRPKIGVAAFLIDVCGHAPSDVARSLVWPSSSAGIRTGRRRQLIHEVARTWFGRGPQHWQIDLDAVTSDRLRRAIWWEIRFLTAIIGSIFLGLLIVEQALVGDLFS